MGATADPLTRLAVLHRELGDAYAEMAEAQEHTAPAPERPAEVLRIQEACRRAQWRYSWAVKHWRALGGFKDADGGLKIRADVLARHVSDPR